MIILSQPDLNNFKYGCELVLFIPCEVSVGFAECNNCLVLLTHVEHFLYEFRVWEVKISLLLQNILEVTSLIKLVRSVKWHVGANYGCSVSIPSYHIGYRFKDVLVLGGTFGDSLQSLLLYQLLELSHLLLVLDSWQAHIRLRIVNRSDVTHVSEIVMVG